MDRREFLRRAAALSAVGALAGTFWRRQYTLADVIVGTGPYGALLPADANGIQLPAGFTSRVVAVTGATVGPTGYRWHSAPDGGACFPTGDGGWVYVSNSEVTGNAGGASAIRFAPGGAIVDAYRILSGTSRNCAGGPTPWGRWLSCEERGVGGTVWECDPMVAGQGTQRPALGAFNHEAAGIDPATGIVYLTEDDPAGRLYRFVPAVPGDLSAGSLFAASVTGTAVSWVPTSPTEPDRQASTTAFDGGEGIWVHDDRLFFTTKGDGRVWELALATQTLTVLYDDTTTPSAPLTGVDNLTAHAATGDLYVAEDGGNMEICVIARVGAERHVTPFLRVLGHTGSELTGPAFSPDGTRLYLSSQRGADGATGVTYEISGPFRTSVPDPDPEPVVLARDTFSRSVTNGWGTTDTGHPWTLTGPTTAFNVTNGNGTITGTINSNRAAHLRTITTTDIDLTADIDLTTTATGTGAYLSLITRRTTTTNPTTNHEYRAKLRYAATGQLTITLVRTTNNTETVLATTNLPGLTHTPGTPLRIRAHTTGTTPTTLRAKVWNPTTPEPTTWHLTTTDTHTPLQQPGTPGILLYTSSTWTGPTPTIHIDQLTATAPP